MKTRTINIADKSIVEVVSPDVLIKDTRDALDLIGNVSSEYFVLHEHNFDRDFFDLSTRKLGDVLQKFDNYRIKVAIVGDFDKYTSKALKAFIYETNRYGQFLFVSSVEEVIGVWQQAG